VTGQLWFDSASGLLKIFTGTTFKSLSSAAAQTTAPTTNVIGDMWFDTSLSQLRVFDGTTFVLIGPQAASGAGSGTSGAVVSTVQDSIAVDHIIIKIYVENDVVAIISKSPPFLLGTPLTGFASTINPGVQLATLINGQNPGFTGTATNAALLDSIASTSFVRSDAADTKTAGDLTFVDGVKASFGTGEDLSIFHNSADSFLQNTTGSIIIDNTTLGGTTILKSNDSGGTSRLSISAGGNTPEVILYHGGAAKLTTTATGADVTGVLTVDGTAVVLTSAIGVSVQGHNADYVVDASYVHTDVNFTAALKAEYDSAVAIAIALG
jgi:hypothetical protein